MEFEVLNFYEIKREDAKQHIVGTLHVRILEIGLDLKGILAFRKKNFWMFRIPRRTAFDRKLGKSVEYGIFLFDTKEKNDKFFDFLHTKGKEFIEACLATTPEETKSVEDAKESPSTPSMSIGQARDKKAKQTQPAAKPSKASSSILKIASTEFVDLPPRKPAFTKIKQKGVYAKSNS